MKKLGIPALKIRGKDPRHRLDWSSEHLLTDWWRLLLNTVARAVGYWPGSEFPLENAPGDEATFSTSCAAIGCHKGCCNLNSLGGSREVVFHIATILQICSRDFELKNRTLYYMT